MQHNNIMVIDPLELTDEKEKQIVLAIVKGLQKKHIKVLGNDTTVSIADPENEKLRIKVQLTRPLFKVANIDSTYGVASAKQNVPDRVLVDAFIQRGSIEDVRNDELHERTVGAEANMHFVHWHQQAKARAQGAAAAIFQQAGLPGELGFKVGENLDAKDAKVLEQATKVARDTAKGEAARWISTRSPSKSAEKRYRNTTSFLSRTKGQSEPIPEPEEPKVKWVPGKKK